MTDDTTTTTDEATTDEATEPAAEKAPKVILGQPVQFISGKGKTKLGLVVGTPDTVVAGTSLGYTLDENEVTLVVFSPSGQIETKKKIAFSTDAEATRVWRLV